MSDVAETKGRFKGAPRKRNRAVATKGGEPLTRQRAAFAVDLLRRRGVLGAASTHKVSARIDKGLLAAARARLGEGSDTELITAALALLAGGDDFGAWLVGRAGTLPEDFELGF